MNVDSKSVRGQAFSLFAQGYGYKYVARVLDMSVYSAKEYYYTYRSQGSQAEHNMSKQQTYSLETKLQAVLAVIDNEESKASVLERLHIRSMTSLKSWIRAYKQHGVAGLEPRAAGRPQGSKSQATDTSEHDELIARIEYLEAENAYLKKLQALKASR
ncbi:transposase [Alloscardovia theropitheci]|uniref:Transposase n=1 Tax=Alloscardovia theropitheci TaxID=2496842 RepID=A0A4R0QYG7_9BIFI|nr:helix-turn-helix domain-containing protein [Alloscardovia theropitheci]TCD54661.1 transposase [Alloscardovia theropitheci]